MGAVVGCAVFFVVLIVVNTVVECLYDIKD